MLTQLRSPLLRNKFDTVSTLLTWPKGYLFGRIFLLYLVPSCSGFSSLPLPSSERCRARGSLVQTRWDALALSPQWTRRFPGASAIVFAIVHGLDCALTCHGAYASGAMHELRPILAMRPTPPASKMPVGWEAAQARTGEVGFAAAPKRYSMGRPRPGLAAT